MSRTAVYSLGDVELEWDEDKAEANWRKHGVTFREAATVFLDTLAHFYEDPEHSEGEPRFLLLGASYALRTLLVVHVERAERTRIISARLANRKERAMIANR